MQVGKSWRPNESETGTDADSAIPGSMEEPLWRRVFRIAQSSIDYHAPLRECRLEKAGGLMNPKLAQTLIRLYPAQWRSRYGEEFAALLKDKNFTAEDSFDVILSAITERIRLLGESMPSNRETAINLAADLPD